MFSSILIKLYAVNASFRGLWRGVRFLLLIGLECFHCFTLGNGQFWFHLIFRIFARFLRLFIALSGCGIVL